AFGGCAHLVVADLERRENEDAASVGFALEYQTGVGICERYRSGRNDCIGGVLHNASDGSLIDLRPGCRSCNRQEAKANHPPCAAKNMFLMVLSMKHIRPSHL